MTMKLYEINQSIRKLLDEGYVCDEETGELLFDGSVGLHELELLREEKILSVAKYAKELAAEIDAHDEERKRIVGRLAMQQKQMERKMEWLKMYLSCNMTEGEKVKDNLATISWRKSASVELTIEPTALPAEFQRVKVEADKTAIKSALESGAVVEGATIVTKQTIVIK